MMNNNLPELRDIHLPGGVSFFPPAYGWWIILAGVIVLIFLFKAVNAIRKKSKKRYALKLIGSVNLNNIIPAAIAVSETLRRICVYKYPEANAVYGREWIDFLNAHSGQTLTGSSADLLINAPYIPANTKEYTVHDINDLAEFAAAWIGENL